MIKQDYIIRMIQTVIAALAEVLLNKKRFRAAEWAEYDGIIQQILGFTEQELVQKSPDELQDLFQNEPEKWDKLELAAMKMLQIATATDDLLLQSRLRQQGLQLLKKVQTNGNSFSLQRDYLIKLIEMNS